MIERNFVPGTEWLYIKIYTGIKTADIILNETLLPMFRQFEEKAYISKWFFIRYNDPKPHLRVRLNLIDVHNYDIILDIIYHQLNEYIESGEISKYILDTYSREIERYGIDTMESAESLFHKNSDLVLQFLNHTDEEKIIATIFYIDKMLLVLNLSMSEKID